MDRSQNACDAGAHAGGSISIVIPVWGTHVAYLPPAVESLVAQLRDGDEIVIADNCSDPPVTSPDSRARVIRTAERLRVGAVRNAGLAAARQSYVMFWDADDVLLPGALERMRGALDRDDDVVAVTMDSVRWTPETGPGERWPWPRAVMYPLTRRRRLFALLATVHNPFTTTGPALMRTSAVRDAGGFPEDIAFFEDWALSGSLAVRGRIVMLREIGRWYRVHGDSLSLGHLDNPDQVDWLRGMRARLRRDPAAPMWLKALLPLIRVAHLQREHRRPRKAVGGGYYESALERLEARDDADVATASR